MNHKTTQIEKSLFKEVKKELIYKESQHKGHSIINNLKDGLLVINKQYKENDSTCFYVTCYLNSISSRKKIDLFGFEMATHLIHKILVECKELDIFACWIDLKFKDATFRAGYEAGHYYFQSVFDKFSVISEES